MITIVVTEIIKSWANARLTLPIYFYRDQHLKEINLLIDYNDMLYPIEIKKAHRVKKDATKNFNVLKTLKRKISPMKTIISNCDNINFSEDNTIIIPVSYI